MKKLSIIFPCYNEAEGIPYLKENIAPVIQQLQSTYDIELLFIDDGSKDDTYQLLDEHFGSEEYVRIIRHAQNKNLGGALRTGFHYATGDIIATFDADCTFPPSLLPEMLAKLDEKHQIVTVSPYHPHGTIESTEGFRIFLSKAVSFMYRSLLNSGIYTHGALARVYTREVIDTVTFRSQNFLSVTELLSKAVLQGYNVAEVPTALRKRKFGQSSLKLMPVIQSHVRFLSKIAAHRMLKRKL